MTQAQWIDLTARAIAILAKQGANPARDFLIKELDTLLTDAQVVHLLRALPGQGIHPLFITGLESIAKTRGIGVNATVPKT